MPVLLALRDKVWPEQIGLEFTEIAGAAGFGFTVAVVVPGRLIHPALVAVNVYVPEAAVPAMVMDVFCVVAVNPFGPFQL